MREGHFKWWDTHKVADTAYPDEKLVPGFKCEPCPNQHTFHLPCMHAQALSAPNGINTSSTLAPMPHGPLRLLMLLPLKQHMICRAQAHARLSHLS